MFKVYVDYIDLKTMKRRLQNLHNYSLHTFFLSLVVSLITIAATALIQRIQ